MKKLSIRAEVDAHVASRVGRVIAKYMAKLRFRPCDSSIYPIGLIVNQMWRTWGNVDI